MQQEATVGSKLLVSAVVGLVLLLLEEQLKGDVSLSLLGTTILAWTMIR